MLKKLKDLFVVEDGKDGAKKETPKVNKKPAPKKPTAAKNDPSAPKIDTTPPPRGEGQPEEKFVNRLLQSLEENNLEGFDYLEYKQSLQSLGGMQMDEATKFKSSLAMAKTMGGTPDRLISSANHYLKVLDKEEKKFQEALANQQNRVVSGQKTSIKQLEESIAQKEKQIEQFKLEIAKQKEQLKKTKTSIDGEVAKIQTTKMGFYAAYHIVVDQIKDDVAKMSKYFKA